MASRMMSCFGNVPGPFLARFTRLWELRQMLRGEFHETIVKLHKQHGPIVRISPNLYSLNSPADQKKIYNLRADLSKTPYYDAGGHPQRPNLFSTQDASLHADRKKPVANLYSMSSMVHYEDAVDRMIKICLRKFAGFAEKRKKVFVPKFMQAYAFDVIGEITINQNFGMMETEADVDGMMELVHASIRYLGTVGIFPEFHSWIFRIVSFLRLRHAGGLIEKIASDTIRKFRHPDRMIEKEDPNSDPFISKLLRLEAAGKADSSHLMDAIASNIAAGSDTTAITLSAALYYLYRTPRALAALRKEIDEMQKAGKISDPVSFKEAQDMPYLQAVILETLRLHPAVGYVLPRKVPAGGMELAGRHLPGGTCVGVSAWALHRNPEAYGDDASEFRPERFLVSEDSSSKNRTASLASSFAFGGGTRSCIGKNISLLEMTKAVPQIVRKFDLVFESDEPWELFSTWFVWQKYHCYIEPRKG
ncbi:uncharacterized protein MYCFIDRAFT_77669 [Pseudocercospora fijiensis CIRAD86]|uniref:Cytochrome P450 n=1 Tax=Pseudocercospora fijiensis (strain CIRAD86) TaxID=383855 RepID=M3ABR8_PSEFD|nr:uncharacterized protein MYCFIDRAFT_77669 [Pseudocercospora fijiensis CIRAD86]EME82021.1 hypothetical protein MYCFIDRAFT_77669 [Pseudocercospora fijiensis CIRAD86]